MLQSPNCSRVCGLSDLNKTYLWKKFELKKNEEVYPVFFVLDCWDPLKEFTHIVEPGNLICVSRKERAVTWVLFSLKVT